jgi:glycosyltransferase involved in cell wall biosynthesis
MAEALREILAGRLSVSHHTAMQSRGGAVRVAFLLHQGLLERGAASRMSFEIAESAGPEAIPTEPGRVGASLPAGALLHLHSSADYEALLAALPAGRRFAVTLHDASLIGGGCSYPLDCDGPAAGCPDPCPRGFPDSARTRKARLGLLTRLAPQLIAPSRWLAGLARQALPGLPLRVIPNGVPWPGRPPQKNAARQSLGVNPAARVVLFAAHGGQRAGYKAGARWVGYWRAIKAAVPEALGFAVGGEDARREGDLVVWPYVDREKLALLMAAADVLLYPTLADNHPLVVLEAMAARLACVSFAAGGVPEQIVHGETGLLVPPGDEAGFSAAAVSLLRSPGQARELGANAFDFGARRFTARRMVEDHVTLYLKLAPPPGGPPDEGEAA